MADIKVIKTICALSEVKEGFQKELNIVSVDGGPFAYDIREWRLDHFDYRDGISLDEKEATQLLINLRQSFGLKDSDLDVAQIQMPVVEQTFAAPAEQKPDIETVLKEKGIAYIDKRKHGGALWIIGGHELDDLMAELKGMGFRFWFSEKGGRVSKNQPAWFIAK